MSVNGVELITSSDTLIGVLMLMSARIFWPSTSCV